jgi:hypothetical protein
LSESESEPEESLELLSILKPVLGDRQRSRCFVTGEAGIAVSAVGIEVDAEVKIMGEVLLERSGIIEASICGFDAINTEPWSIGTVLKVAAVPDVS